MNLVVLTYCTEEGGRRDTLVVMEMENGPYFMILYALRDKIECYQIKIGSALSGSLCRSPQFYACRPMSTQRNKAFNLHNHIHNNN